MKISERVRTLKGKLPDAPKLTPGDRNDIMLILAVALVMSCVWGWAESAGPIYAEQAGAMEQAAMRPPYMPAYTERDIPDEPVPLSETAKAEIELEADDEETGTDGESEAHIGAAGDDGGGFDNSGFRGDTRFRLGYADTAALGPGPAAAPANISDDWQPMGLETDGGQNPPEAAARSDPTEATESEAHLLARMIHIEAHWEEYLGKLAAAQTAIDRYETNPGRTLESILRSGQYLLANNKHGCGDCLEAAEDALDGARAFPDHRVYHFRSVTHTDDWKMPNSTVPYIGHIGTHAFYGWVRAEGEDK